MHRPTLSIGLALLLGGCTMIPTYHRPKAPIAQTWPGGTAYQSAENTPRNALADRTHWQAFYQDPVMQSLIASALQTNRDYRIARQQIDTASAQFDIETASLFPTLDGTASAQVQKYQSRIMHLPTSTSANAPIYLRRYGLGFGVSAYEVDLWGRIRSASRAAFDRYMGDVFTREAVNISLKASVATAMLNWVANNEGYHLTNTLMTSWQHSYDLVQESLKTGSANALDLAEAEEALRAAQRQVAIYDRQRAQALNEIELLVGRPLTPAEKTALKTRKSLADVKPFPGLPAGLPSELIQRRPDILAAEQQLRAANDDIGAARADFFPKIQITASNGTASNNIKHLFQSGMGAWDIAPQITVPFFDAGRLTAQLKQVKATRRIDVSRYEKTVQTAFREVADALAARETFLRERKAQDQFTAAAMRQYHLAQARFDSGSDSYLQTLIAQRTWLNAVTAGIAIHLSQQANIVTLYKSLGGGWTTPQKDRPFKLTEHIL